ncbi:MAG: DinB family protein [Bacteroidota bacterium]
MEQTIKELEQILNDFAPKLRDIPDVQFSAKPQPNKWSKKEVIGHLIDSGQSNLRRFVTGQYDENPKITYDQDFWVNANQYQTAAKDDVVLLWVLINRRIIAVLQSMPQSNYTRTCDTGKATPQLRTLEWLASDYVKHMKHHLNQVLPSSFNITYP